MEDLIFFGVVLVFLAFFCFLAFSKRGKNMMFGGRILKTWDGVSGRRKIVTTRVKVHAVEAAPTLRFVGLELSMSSFGGYQMVPITLPLAEAKELARMLSEAAAYPSTTVET